MSRVIKALLTVIAGLVCLVGLSGAGVFADNTGDITASVTVVTLDSITITLPNPSVNLPVGGKYQFKAEASYSNGTITDVTAYSIWTSSNTTVATINPNTGQATILASGNTTIRADFSGKTDTTMLQVSISSSGGNDGGGGGGGGGSTGVTSLADYVTGEGKFVLDATAKSANGVVEVFIPKGTIAQNRVGQPLRYISIKEQPAPTEPSANCSFVSLIYEIRPAGSTFYEHALLTIRYDEPDLPEGIPEEGLVIVTWEDGELIVLEGCVIDTENNTITVPITHLSFFTIMVSTTPPSFELSEITITPSEIYLDDAVTISITVTNTGDLPGSYDVAFTISGLKMKTREVTLGGGDSETVSFTLSPSYIGLYTVDVNGLLSEFAVSRTVPEGSVAEVPPLPAPARFIISELTITPDEVEPSEEISISAVVSNVGESEGSHTVILEIDDEEADRKEISLAPGGSEQLSFNTSLYTVGSHIINISGLTGWVTVKSPPSLPAPTDDTMPENHSTNPLPLVGVISGLILLAVIFVFLLKKYA